MLNLPILDMIALSHNRQRLCPWPGSFWVGYFVTSRVSLLLLKASCSIYVMWQLARGIDYNCTFSCLQNAPLIGKWISSRLNFCAPVKEHTDPCRICNCWPQVTAYSPVNIRKPEGRYPHDSWPKSAVPVSRSMELNLPLRLQAVQVAALAREDVCNIDEYSGSRAELVHNLCMKVRVRFPGKCTKHWSSFWTDIQFSMQQFEMVIRVI